MTMTLGRVARPGEGEEVLGGLAIPVSIGTIFQGKVVSIGRLRARYG